MCRCCIPLQQRVPCQEERAVEFAHLTPPAGRSQGLTTSFWRVPRAPQLTEGPARSETTLDAVLENHPGALNKTEASRHLGRSDLNVFGSEMSPAEGSSSKAWGIETMGSFTLNIGPYLWGNKKQMLETSHYSILLRGTFRSPRYDDVIGRSQKKMDIQALCLLAQSCRRSEHSISIGKILLRYEKTHCRHLQDEKVHTKQCLYSEFRVQINVTPQSL